MLEGRSATPEILRIIRNRSRRLMCSISSIRRNIGSYAMRLVPTVIAHDNSQVRPQTATLLTLPKPYQTRRHLCRSQHPKPMPRVERRIPRYVPERRERHAITAGGLSRFTDSLHQCGAEAPTSVRRVNV